MNIGKAILGTAATLGLLSSTAAMAAETRSGAALPSSQSITTAPVHGVRHASALSGASNQSDGGMSSGAYIAAGLAAAIVIAGVVVAVSNNDNNRPASNG